MPTWRLRTKEGAVYFGAFICFRWIPLIHTTNAYRLARTFGRLRERDR